MITKIVAVRNVGRFRNSAVVGNPELARYTLIVGANGYGKTTLCAVFRSLKTGNPALIAGRKTLGIDARPTVELLLDGNHANFDGSRWSISYPNIEIFDGEFVAENVHSGEVVDIEHRRRLYRVVIGDDGVRLAEQDTGLAVESRDLTREITAVRNAIEPHVLHGMSLSDFLALAADPDIDAGIAQQERALETARQARVIAGRAPLEQIGVPQFPAGFEELIARTIEHVADDASTVLAEHFASHGMTTRSGNWVADGMTHALRDTCPFCGQDIKGVPLIAAYRAMFSEQYNQLRGDIARMRTEVSDKFGEGAIGQLRADIERRKADIDFWRKYCDFDSAEVAFPDDYCATMEKLGSVVLRILESKSQAPLDPLKTDDEYEAAAEKFRQAQKMARDVVGGTLLVNETITARKRQANEADVETAQSELARRHMIKARHSPQMSDLCGTFARLTEEKASIDQLKAEVRAQLDEHSQNVMQPYQRRINQYLDAFNAGFTIAETRHSYPGGVAACSYQLVINNTAVGLGDRKTNTNEPCFKNTLSSGDRATLALSFFLTHLEHDRNLAEKTVIFDDPFNSQDSFRRRQTIYEISKIGDRCAQVIVLSHDATFLKQIWDKVSADRRLALTLADHRAQGSKLTAIDLERACLGRTANDIDDLQAFLATGAGTLVDLIRKIRAVLETHCWTNYPAFFQAGQDWLGEIVKKIRESGDDHPAHDLLGELDQINEYTRQYYHGEDHVQDVPDDIDPIELTGYVRRALKIANAIQA